MLIYIDINSHVNMCTLTNKEVLYTELPCSFHPSPRQRLGGFGDSLLLLALCDLYFNSRTKVFLFSIGLKKQCRVHSCSEIVYILTAPLRCFEYFNVYSGHSLTKSTDAEDADFGECSRWSHAPLWPSCTRCFDRGGGFTSETRGSNAKK